MNRIVSEATSSVTTIAHWVLATRQILDDVPMLQSYIDGRLTYGLALVEENQLLNGGGTGTDLHGVYTQATAFAPPITIPAPVTRIDVLRLAMLQTALSELMSTGVVLHPSDWAAIELRWQNTSRWARRPSRSRDWKPSSAPKVLPAPIAAKLGGATDQLAAKPKWPG